MKARKMKLVALGLAASMIMGLAAPAMADELSDGFGQEDVLDTESIQENTQENTAETAEGEEESSFKEQLKEDVLSSEEEQEEEIIAMVGAGSGKETDAEMREWIDGKATLIRWALYLALFLAVLLLGVYGPSYDPTVFIYREF